MRVFDTKILAFDPTCKTYTVSYCVDNRNGTVRRSKALYREGTLSKDANNQVLLDQIKEQVSLYSYKCK